MIEMNSIEDIKLVKELAQTFSSDIDSEKIMKLIDESDSIKELRESNKILLEKMEVFSATQKGVLEILDKILESLETKEKEDKVKYPVQPEATSKKDLEPKKRGVRKADSPFEPYSKERKEYQSLKLEGENILHIFMANKKNGYQKHLLPVNIFELLVIAECFIKGERSIPNKNVNKLCELFGLTRPQFSKVYYNLMIGRFDPILSKIEKMISDSVFTFKKSHIYRNNHDTNIDKEDFNELLSIYANADQGFLTIYKLIKEKNDVDPFDLLIVLKKSTYVSKVI